MALAIFDLDETLISIDSDRAWGDYVVAAGLVDDQSYTATNQAFYADYKRGQLDIDAYMTFACSSLVGHSMALLHAHRQEFVASCIKPHILAKAVDLVRQHRQAGDALVVITATMEFVARPIVDLFGIEHLIAPMPEIIENRYTGKLAGIVSFGAGKVTRLQQWMSRQHCSLKNSSFYSDSINDLPLLEQVDHPIAVDPDPRLEKIALERAWRLISLR